MSAAVSYATLKDAISRAYPTLPRQLQHIARFALERPNELALGTVAAVAGAAGVNPSALIRFANALEFGGFSEMQQVFRGHLLERSSSYRERIDQLRHNGRARDPRGGVLHQFVGDAVAELGHMEENVPQAAIDAAVRLISGAGTVHVLAQRRAFPVAAYLAYALGQLELRARLHDGVGGMLATTLRCVEPGDVLIAASFHAYTQEVVDAARAAHDRNVPVIAITDSALSPLKAPSSVCFELSMGAEHAFRSLVAPLCLAQVLVVSTGHQLSESLRARGKPTSRRSATPSTRPHPAGSKRRTAAAT